jgi:hypothetical protein
MRTLDDLPYGARVVIALVAVLGLMILVGQACGHPSTSSTITSTSTAAVTKSAWAAPTTTSQAPAQPLTDEIAAAAWKYVSTFMLSPGEDFGPNYPHCPDPVTETETCWPRYLTKFTVQHDRFLGADLYTLTACLSVDHHASDRDDIGAQAVRAIWATVKHTDAPSIIKTNIDGVEAVDADSVRIVGDSELDLH